MKNSHFVFPGCLSRPRQGGRDDLCGKGRTVASKDRHSHHAQAGGAWRSCHSGQQGSSQPPCPGREGVTISAGRVARWPARNVTARSLCTTPYPSREEEVEEGPTEEVCGASLAGSEEVCGASLGGSEEVCGASLGGSEEVCGASLGGSIPMSPHRSPAGPPPPPTTRLPPPPLPLESPGSPGIFFFSTLYFYSSDIKEFSSNRPEWRNYFSFGSGF